MPTQSSHEGDRLPMPLRDMIHQSLAADAPAMRISAPQGAPAYDKHQRSRMSRATSVSHTAAQELRGPTALRVLRPLGFNALPGSALAGLPPALEGFF
jgi:hypothetical protein